MRGFFGLSASQGVGPDMQCQARADPSGAQVRRCTLPVNFPAAVASAGAIPLHPSGGRQCEARPRRGSHLNPSPRQPQDIALARVKSAARKVGAVHLDAVGGSAGRNWNGGRQGKKVIRIVQTYFSQLHAITFRPALLGNWSASDVLCPSGRQI